MRILHIFRIYLLILGALINISYGDSGKYFCGDPNCTKVISQAKTLLTYNSGQEGGISFKKGEEAKIYAKPVGSEDENWFVEIRGRRGFANKKHLQENKIITKVQDLMKVDLPKGLSSDNPVHDSRTPQLPEAASTDPLLEVQNSVVTKAENKIDDTLKITPKHDEEEVDGTRLPKEMFQQMEDGNENDGEGVDDDAEESTDYGESEEDVESSVEEEQEPETYIDNSNKVKNTFANATDQESSTAILENKTHFSNNENQVVKEDYTSKLDVKVESDSKKFTDVDNKILSNMERKSTNEIQNVSNSSTAYGASGEEINTKTDSRQTFYGAGVEIVTQEKSFDKVEKNSPSNGTSKENDSALSQDLINIKETAPFSKQKYEVESKKDKVTANSSNKISEIGDYTVSSYPQNSEDLGNDSTNKLNEVENHTTPSPQHSEDLRNDSSNKLSKVEDRITSSSQNFEDLRNDSTNKLNEVEDHKIPSSPNSEGLRNDSSNKLSKVEDRTASSSQNPEDLRNDSTNKLNEVEDHKIPSPQNFKDLEINSSTKSGEELLNEQSNNVDNVERDVPLNVPNSVSNINSNYTDNLNEETKLHYEVGGLHQDKNLVNSINHLVDGEKESDNALNDETESIESTQNVENSNEDEQPIYNISGTSQNVESKMENTQNTANGNDKSTYSTTLEGHQSLPSNLGAVVESNSIQEPDVPLETQVLKPNEEKSVEIQDDSINIEDSSQKFEEISDLYQQSSPDLDNSHQTATHTATEYDFERRDSIPSKAALTYDEKIASGENNFRESPNLRDDKEFLDENWLVVKMFETVKGFWSTEAKSDKEERFDETLDKILNSGREKARGTLSEDEYCEKITAESCPSNFKAVEHECSSEKDFFSLLSDKILELIDLVVYLGITAITMLIFSFGYYCISRSRKEVVLLSKLNIVERSLLAANKEVLILKHELLETRTKLASIEDNSFGSNDMVIALRRELDTSEQEKEKLQEQVVSLEKELENAAEAGLELNRIVSELLNNQSGDESIISSVEELQKQLNEQQNTILQINATLAEKSRENSELQLMLADQGTKLQEEIQTLKQQNKDLESDKNSTISKLEESKRLLEEQMKKTVEKKNAEISAMGMEISTLKTKLEDVLNKWRASDAKVQALEECFNDVKKNPAINMKEFHDIVHLKADLLALKRERDSLKERLEGELDARKLLEDHVKIISEEVSSLKQEYNQAEKEKLEAQTRLEVLQTYFKEKETQLQKELSIKEALWLKQQGENTSTIERVRSMQEEIQNLKSQNDSLRAEIEAQATAHKAQIASLEKNAHETWLAARQSERKLEEARSEATALRRKLTLVVENSIMNDTTSQNRSQNPSDALSNDLNNAPSPIHMETPGSPLLAGLPPPPPFLPPPFMPPAHPFIAMPPPFMPPGEMRPPPLGRLMSPPPPPPHDRYSPSIVDNRDRYSPENDRYSPDSRYNYNTDIISNYDTETDFSPPPSPDIRSGEGSGRFNGRDRGRVYKQFSPSPPNSDRNKKSKGMLSSGSADSYDSRRSKGKGKV